MKPVTHFISTLICAGFLAQSAMAEPAAPRRYIDGIVTAQQIESKLREEGFSPLTKIDAEAQDDGTVMLKGVAISDAEAARAVNIAKEVNGVTSVQSEILVKRIQ